jgi:NADH:ubiquinone oxidoreductase subunit C
VKTRVGLGRTEASVASVVAIWRGADYQEREVWDLMGIRFEGHPNHKRIMLWEGFPGHPLRKDYVTYDQSIASPTPEAPKAPAPEALVSDNPGAGD